MYKNWSMYVDMNCSANKVAKFHAKRLYRNENIPKTFRGG